MLLSKVSISNFRCIRSINIDLDPTTVIIGENNSGKTSFLDAIRLCLSRSVMRRSGLFSDYDYHLPSGESEPKQADELCIVLRFSLEEGDDEIIQALEEVVVIDESGDGQSINFQVKSKFDDVSKDFVSEWSFLDSKGNALPTKPGNSVLLGTLIQFVPLFYLSALRDAAREFQSRAPYWSPFLRNPDLSDEVRQRLQEEIGALNEEVLKSHKSLTAVKDRLAKVQQVVSIGGSGTVDIEALPGRISDLLSRTQINICGPTGAALPLVRHGAGTQSLAVIFLFEAFSATMLTEQYDALSRPLLALEEPEAHLHPCATRSLWAALESIDGQKIIATHSGDLLARVPLASIRRFCRTDGSVTVRKLQPSMLDPDELRKVEFHIRSTRGELLFARCWLLGEGESEYWIFNEVAEILGHDLDRLGIRIVTYQHCGIRPLLKVANDLGIAWFVTTDGDHQGKKDRVTCEALLNSEAADSRIKTLSQANIEAFLCDNGFGEFFEKHISPQKVADVSAPKGTPEYWAQVLKARDDTPKPTVLREILDEMRRRGPLAVPAELKGVIDSAITLAGTNS